MGTEPQLGEVLFEFRPIGNVVRVSAIHVASNTEVFTMGPRTAGTSVLQAAALQKLIYVLGKKAG